MLARTRGLVGLICLGASLNLQAQTPWEWEVGAGVATLSFPAYRGSSHRRQWVLPLPNLSISSERLQLGRRGAQLTLLEAGPLRIRLSASGSLPVDSDDLPLRAGMPDLDPSFELGPALSWEFPKLGDWELKPELLIRGVLATNLRRFQTIGWVTQPRLSLRRLSKVAPRHKTDLRWTIGPVLASHRYHAYFYSVAPEFADAQRPAFNAAGGFSGWRSTLSGKLTRQRLGLTAFLSYDNMNLASFAASPLVERDQYWVAGFVMTWMLFGSEEGV